MRKPKWMEQYIWDGLNESGKFYLGLPDDEEIDTKD